MADYEFAFRLDSMPLAKNDGSGVVQWNIWAVSREDGTADPWVSVPGRHKTIETPVSELAIVNAMPDSTGPECAAKTAAYKQLLVDNLNTVGTPISGWSAAQLEMLMDNNDTAIVAATDANSYITVRLGLSYPVTFTL